MTCYQSGSFPAGASTQGRRSYATQAECLQACKEGACCEGTTCSVKPQCQCQGAGKTFKGIGTTCVNPFAKAQSIEVNISSSDRVSHYKQQIPPRFPADSNCCLQSSDELFTSYVFAGGKMSGAFSLTKLAAAVPSLFGGYVQQGDWLYSFSDDDISFELVLSPAAGVLQVNAVGWMAWHWQINENGWCQQPNSIPPFDCRSPTTHTAKYYGVGGRQSAINDDYVLSCINAFIQQCSSGFGSPCFHGPASVPTPPGARRRGATLAGAASGAYSTAVVALNCKQSQNGVITAQETAKATALMMTDYFCGFAGWNGSFSQFRPILQSGDALAISEFSSGVLRGELPDAFTLNSVAYT